MSESTNGMMQMFGPEVFYSIRVMREVNGYPILTGYILRADPAGLWLDWHVNEVVRKVYVPFTNITHIEERGYEAARMDELAEIRRKEEDLDYAPWEDRSGDEHYELYEREPGQRGRLTPTVVRVFAAILLILMLYLTFQYVTFSFFKPGPTPNPGAPPPGLVT